MPNPLDPIVPDDRQPAADAPRPERRIRRIAGGVSSPRLEAAQYVARHRLEAFERALGGLAVAVFGGEASVMAHMRGEGRRKRLTFVVDAADPSASVDYGAFLPREQTFWTAYAQLAKPPVPFSVAIRPARGWCRNEALAPLFAYLPATDEPT